MAFLQGRTLTDPLTAPIQRGKGERNIYCPFDGCCVDRAAKLKWEAFNCEACPQYLGRDNPGPVFDPDEQIATGQDKRPTKACRKCGEEKDLERGFSRDRRSKSGHVSVCKQCRHEQYESGKKEGNAMADKVKTCNRCDEEQPLDHEHFQKSNKTGDGFTNVCRKCSKPKGPKKKAANQAPRKSRRKRPTLSPEKGSPSPQNQNASLILDLTDYPEVVEHLAEAARINIRTLNHQAIAYIVAGLKKEPSGTASTAQENQDDRPAEPGQG